MNRWNKSLRSFLSMFLSLTLLMMLQPLAYAGEDDLSGQETTDGTVFVSPAEQTDTSFPAEYDESAGAKEDDPASDNVTPLEESVLEEPSAGGADLIDAAQAEGAEQAGKPELQTSIAPMNLALHRGASAFTLEMEGAGTDLDPSTQDIAIRAKEEQSLPRLTDGYYGNGNILSGSWNGTGMRSKYYEAYRNIDRVITLDLGQASHIQRLSFHMQEGIVWGISAPAVVTWYLSEDGENFHRVGRVTRFDAVPDTEETHVTQNCASFYYLLDNLNYNARYVKLAFELTGTWAFADELEVLGLTTPSADADALPNTPGTDNEIVGHYATAEQSRGIRHEGLAYAGHYVSGNVALKTSEKTVEQLLPMVGYVDESGKITDTFFDSVTFLSHGYTPNTDNPADAANFYHHLLYDAGKMNGMENPASICATKADWQAYLDFLFDYTDGTGAKFNLDALEEAVAQVKAATDKTDYTVGVKVAFYPPILCQDDWGALPGGDHSLNFKVSETNAAEQARADRIAASRWYLDQVVSRFAAKNYKNIRLDGFYWYDEIMHYDVDPLVLETVQDVTSYVHSLNDGAYQIYWIPFYQASGFRAWKTFGFDYAIMQPNYAFDANASEQRIFDTAELCKKYGLGIEMEFGGISDSYIEKFRQYLINGAESKLGYQNHSLIGWYAGTWGVEETSKDQDGTRYIYDAMYDFYTGVPTSMTKPNENLASSGKLTLEAAGIKDQTAYAGIQDSLGILIDGNQKSAVWGNDYIQINKNQVAGPFVLTSELENPIVVTQLSLDFIGRADWGIGTPDAVTYSISADGVKWTQVGTVSCAEAVKKTSGAGFETADYILNLNDMAEARYIRATFNHGTDPSKNNALYTWLGVDEFTVHGRAPKAPVSVADGTVTLKSQNVLNNTAFADRQAVAAVLLKDGELRSGSWTNVNTLDGHYVGLLQGVAAGPYTVQIAFDAAAQVESFGLDFMTWESAGVGAPDQVTYYSSLDGETWIEAAVVKKADAQYYPAIATGINGYHFLVQNNTPLHAKYLKAVFDRGYNPGKDAKWGWVAFDEFTVSFAE